MKSRIQERREFLLQAYVETLSVKKAVQTCAKEYNVSEETVRSDWRRRRKWQKNTLNSVRDPILFDIYYLGIHRTLLQIERELTQNSNPSCRVGLLKAKAEILFKLMDVQETIVHQEILMNRIRKMEKRLDTLHNQQK